MTSGKYVRTNKRNYSLLMIIFVCIFGVQIIGGDLTGMVHEAYL